MKRRKVLVGILLALVLTLLPVAPALAVAGTSQDITVTATPAFIAIAIAQDTWTINGIDGTGKIAPATTYYSNETGATGDVTAPTATVIDGDCYFTVVNTSTITTDLTTNMIHFTGGDTMQNSGGGYTDAEAGEFGASTYVTGAAWPGAAVICDNAGSAAMKEDLAATTDIKFGIAIKTQSDAWASGDAMNSTITVTATDST